MRFDDSLETVLAADATTPFGAQSAWRQLLDMLARRRVTADPALIDRLAALKARVPLAVRVAGARAIAAASPPLALVQLLAADDARVASPLLRDATLPAEAWLALLPALTPALRAVLRHRRDLPEPVVRGLASFGAIDFVLSNDTPAAGSTDAARPAAAAPGTTTFVSLASIARELPVVAEALHQTDRTPADETAGTFQIADLVARIAAYQRKRDDAPVSPRESQPELFALEQTAGTVFRFETDPAGIVRWVDGVSRAPLIGLSLDFARLPGVPQVDGVAAGAFRRRASFADARLRVEGLSDAAGEWRISGVPAFDRASGRFTGYRGTARRPRADESAAPTRRNATSDALRQLVHELRTPANAIAGFAEMIEGEMLGPVSSPYRAQATTIRDQAAALLGAIDDIDMAARIESAALDLRRGEVPVEALLTGIAADLAPLAKLRGATLALQLGPPELVIAGDDRAVERLVGRLVATLVASASNGERLAISAKAKDETILLRFDRPVALAAIAEEGLLTIDAEIEAERDGAPLLGTGFALRLARNLAREMGGALTIGATRLTLRLPAALVSPVEQASQN